jgi:hypothetical protein
MLGVKLRGHFRYDGMRGNFRVMRQRGAEALATEEPDELMAHVRVCGGVGWVTTGSTRKPIPSSVRSYVVPASGRGSPRALDLSPFCKKAA